MTAFVRRLDANGDMSFGHGFDDYAVGAEAAAQRLTTRLYLVLGEWFLDQSAGVPWVQLPGIDTTPILGAAGAQNFPLYEAILKTTALETDGVASLISLGLSLDHQTRKLTAAGRVVAVDDNIFDIEVSFP